MRYLLDTHVLLWMFDENENISKNAYKIIEDTNNQCFISIISLYEIAIKKNIGKLNTSISISRLSSEIEKVGIDLLPISLKHLEKYIELPQVLNHKDPFDRLIIATGISENLQMITADEKFDNYSALINIIW